MTNAQHTAPTFVEGTTRTMPVSRVTGHYNLPANTESVIITADYRDVYDGRRDLKNVERGPVAVADLPRTAQRLRSRGFTNLRFSAA